MEQIKVNQNNEQYYSKEFVRGFNLGAQRQYELDRVYAIQAINCWFKCNSLPQVGEGILYGIPSQVKGADNDRL